MKHLKEKDYMKWLEHSIHHTPKHLDEMLKHYKNGKSFNQSHTLSLKKM